MELEQAWAAGLFSANGTIAMQNGKLTIRLNMVDCETLERFAAAVDVPGVLGPYKNSGSRQDFYVWSCPVASTSRVLDLLWPLLTLVRRSRAVSLGYEVSTESRT